MRRKTPSQSKRRRRSLDASINGRPPKQENTPIDVIMRQNILKNEIQNDGPSPPFAAILLLGLTGVGKSTFISHLTQATTGVGHSLTSCTKDVNPCVFERPNGQNIYLIDTPGFDDTEEGNAQILQRIAMLLRASYQKDCLQIMGILYFHRISDVRMSGSSMKSIRILEKMCGKGNFPAVFIVTTMWSMVPADIANEREQSLVSKPEFFGEIIGGGATTKRYDNTFESAYQIVEDMASKEATIVLGIQREMVDEGVPLINTAAGQCLIEESEVIRLRHEMKIKRLHEALQEAQEGEEEDLLSEILEQQKEYEEHMNKAALTTSTLSMTHEQMAQLQEEWFEERLNEAIAQSAGKSAREIELEEQLTRTEMDHIREMNKLRLANEGKIIENEQLKRDREILKQRTMHQPGQEKAQRVGRSTKTSYFQLIEVFWSGFGRAFVELVSTPHPQRANTYPLERKSPKPRSSSKKPSGKEHLNGRRLKKSRKKEERSREKGSKYEEIYQEFDSDEAEVSSDYEEEAPLTHVPSTEKPDPLAYRARWLNSATHSASPPVISAQGLLRVPGPARDYVKLPRSYPANEEQI